MRKVLFISLGCDKNLADSEEMLGMLVENGYTLTNDETEAEVIVDVYKRQGLHRRDFCKELCSFKRDWKSVIRLCKDLKKSFILTCI